MMLQVILYDGSCNLCKGTVNFIAKHDTNKLFTLLSLQSDEGQFYLKKYNLPTDNFDTVVLIKEDKAFTESTAVLKILKKLSHFSKYFYIFIIIPKVMRDFIYRLIAKNRYIFFKNNTTCELR